MIEEAEHFRTETQALDRLLSHNDIDYEAPTFFKGWTTDQILRHLHFWNDAARISLEDPDNFQALLNQAMPSLMSEGMRSFEDDRLGAYTGASLVALWRDGAETLANSFAGADPEQRLAWAGPPMSARSSISARLMETWAHSQAIYDGAGIVREDGDHIYPIAELGVRTFGWTYAVRGEERPSSKPFVKLTAPSGEIWSFNEERTDEFIKGPATAFCQVVTQTRNIADTDLLVRGPISEDWMSKAQCFAGGAETPPAPGLRRTASPDERITR